jgi:tetratricopeptide (TPR) repeat protein
MGRDSVGQAALHPAVDRARASGPLVGRDPELTTLGAAWAATGASAPVGLMLIEGEPGAGKTRLAAEQAVRAHGDGAAVLFGRCDLEVPAPFRPWLTVLTQLLGIADGALVAAHGSELARLTGDADVPAPGDDPEVARLRLLAAAVGLITGVAAAQPLVIILDDLHVADRATLQLLRELLQGPDAHVLVLATMRDTEREHSEPFRAALPELLRESGTRRLAVGGLDLEAARELVVAELGDTARADALASTLIADTDGNPLFAIELLRHVAEAGTSSSLPGTITEVVHRRAASLGDGAARVLRYAAALGRSFDFALLVHVTQDDEDDVLDALEAGCRAALVTELAGARFQFTHAVIQHALVAELSEVRRRRLHRRAAEWLAAASERDAVRTGELALHWAAAGSEFAEQAVAAAVDAGEHALSVLALDDAVRAFARALALHEQSGAEPDEQTVELMLRLGEAEQRAGHVGYGDRLLAAAELAQARGDTLRLVRAALANSRGITSDFRVTDTRRIAVLEAALEAVGDDSLRDRALLTAALATEHYRQRDRRLELADEALALARAAGDDAALAEILYRRCMSIAEPATVPDRIMITGELGRLAERLDAPMVRFRAAVERGRVLFEAGRADAIEAQRRVTELAPATGAAFATYLASSSRAALLHAEGRLDEAEVEAQRGMELGAGVAPDAMELYAAQMVPIRWDQGRLGEFADFAIAAAEQDPDGQQGFGALIPVALVEADRPDEAREWLDRGVADGMPVEVNTVYIVGAALWAEAALRLRHEAAAAICLERLAPWRDQYVWTGVSLMGSVARLVAGLAALLGRDAEAERDFRLAEQVDERIGAPGPLARTLIDHGAWSGDRERLERGRELAARFGFPRLVAAAEAALGAPAARPASGSITAALVREGDVWTLTFDGRVTRLKDAKGLHYLVRLLDAPGVEQHALELTGDGAGATSADPELSVRSGTGDAGPALDPQAKAEYRARVEALREELEEAEAFNDPERAARAREELDWIGRSLSQAVGLGGRDRPQNSDAERARVNVTRALKALVKRIGEHDERAARVLDATVRTGVFCVYEPDPDRPIDWSLPD